MAYKGRLSIKVYNPKKPKKYGVKFFVTESSTSYVLDFSIYSGVYSTLRDTVFGLVDRFRNQGYHLFMDNYYNSVSLALELYDAGIHCSGTLRLVRRAPTVLQRLGQNPQQLARGDTVWRRKADVFVICWKGVRLVPMITTSDEPMQEEIVQRKKTRRQGRVHYEEVRVQRPTVIGHYNRHMWGGGGGGRLVRPTHSVLPLRQENQTLDHKAAQVPHPAGPPERLHPLLWVYHRHHEVVPPQVFGGGRGGPRQLQV